MIRLYFNTHGSRPWSVDEGPGTEEKSFILISTAKVQGITKYEPDLRGSQEQPCAWVEFSNCRLREGHGMAEILPL